jgi:hypothetical protein
MMRVPQELGVLLAAPPAAVFVRVDMARALEVNSFRKVRMRLVKFV